MWSTNLWAIVLVKQMFHLVLVQFSLASEWGAMIVQLLNVFLTVGFQQRIANAGPSRLPPKAIMQSFPIILVFVLNPWPHLKQSCCTVTSGWYFASLGAGWVQWETSLRNRWIGSVGIWTRFWFDGGCFTLVGVSCRILPMKKTPGNLWSVFFWMLQIVLEIEDVFGSVEGVISWFGDIYGLI